jgi:alpha-tubulin suppressor-like RCC1 family protein
VNFNLELGTLNLELRAAAGWKKNLANSLRKKHKFKRKCKAPMKTLHNFSLLVLFLHVLAAHAAITVTNISAGELHSLFVKSDGSLWGMGCSLDGELGDGTSGVTNQPEEFVTNSVIAVAAGGVHSLFLESDGSLWGMGGNYNGELGDGTFSRANLPEEIVASGVTAIAAGGHSLFLKSDGSLWGMGINTRGELGNGTFNLSTNLPEEIVTSGVTAIAAGGEFSLFLKSDGSLWAMGANLYGQLGDETYSQNDPYYGVNLPEKIVASGVTAIAAGGSHSLFLKSDGSLWAMGANAAGQLGDGTFNNTNQPEEIVASGVTAIAAGGGHSLFLKSDGSLWGMGDNSYGQLGDGTYDSTNKPEEIVASGVIAISAGGYQSLFLKSDGSLWATGWNYYGQLGDGFVDSGYPPYNPYGTATPERIFPPSQPVLVQTISSNTNLQFTAACGFGGNFYLLAATNLTEPLNQWTPVWTNSVTSRGTNNFSATLTNAVNSGTQQFFILQSQ